jgi:hypothetical protein
MIADLRLMIGGGGVASLCGIPGFNGLGKKSGWNYLELAGNWRGGMGDCSDFEHWGGRIFARLFTING